MSLWQATEDRLTRRISGAGLGLFRILYACTLAVEILQMLYFERLDFNPSPFTFGPAALRYTAALWVWLGSALALMVGFQTTTAAIISYACTCGIMGQFVRWEYHVDYYFLAVGAVMVAAPMGSRLSFDAARGRRSEERDVAAGWHYLLLIVGCGLTYISSVVLKLNSPMWLRGLGIWQPSVIPSVAWWPAWLAEPLTDQEWLMKGLSHLTVAFEAAFLGLIWCRRLWPLIIAIGLGLHLGIAVVFPIPMFGLAVASLYALIVPAGGLDQCLSRLPRLRAWDVRQYRVLRWPDFADRRRQAAAFVIVTAVLFGVQLDTSLHGPFQRVFDKYGVTIPTTLGFMPVRGFVRAMGINPHGVFMDSHFNGYNDILALQHIGPNGQKDWLPISTRDGQPSTYAIGRQWVAWTFRTVAPQLQYTMLRRGIARYTAFWLFKQGIPRTDARFEVLGKKIRVPFRWTPGLLRESLQAPWRVVGEAHWTSQTMLLTIEDLEAKTTVP